MIRAPSSKLKRIVLGLVTVTIILVGYGFLSYRQHQLNPKDTTIPSYSQLWDGVEKAVKAHPLSGKRWLSEDTAATLERLGLGLLFGIVLALLIGVHMGAFTTFGSLLLPAMQLMSKMTPTAMLAVFFALVGTQTKMYTTMIAFGIMPTLAMSIYLGMKDVPDELIHKAYTLGAGHLQVIWRTMVPQVIPKMIDAIRLQIGPAIVFLIAAEMVVGDAGFGYRIRLQSRLLNMDVVYVYIAVLTAFGFLVDYMLIGLQRWLSPWYEGGRS